MTALENLAPRQQILVLKRSVKRAKLEDSDRIFWILMPQRLDNRSDALVIVAGVSLRLTAKVV